MTNEEYTLAAWIPKNVRLGQAGDPHKERNDKGVTNA